MTWASRCGRRGARGSSSGVGPSGNLDAQPCPTPARAERGAAGRGGHAPAGGARNHSLSPAQRASAEREERSCPRAGTRRGDGPPLAPPHHGARNLAQPIGAMHKAGLLLGACVRSWKSVRMASSGVARRDPLANKVALVTASTDG